MDPGRVPARLGAGRRRSSAGSATGSAAAARSALTILTYALFTGLSSFAQTWWQLLIFRFLAALGIGGEWAVGASLLSETWPQALAAVDRRGAPDRRQPRHPAGRAHRRPAVARAAAARERCVFLVGVLPALLVFWIRRAGPRAGGVAARRARESRGSGRGVARPVPRRRRAGSRCADDPRLRARADGAGRSCSGSRSTCAACSSTPARRPAR